MHKNWVETHSHKAFDLIEPCAHTIDLEDIAFSLAHTNRYNGHAGAYSVAQHAVHCAETAAILGLPQHVQAAVLFHDAHEAYLGDIVGPLKSLLRYDLELIENRVDQRMAERFGLDTSPETQIWIARIDHFLLHIEAGVFFPEATRPHSWGFDEVALAHFSDALRNIATTNVLYHKERGNNWCESFKYVAGDLGVKPRIGGCNCVRCMPTQLGLGHE